MAVDDNFETFIMKKKHLIKHHMISILANEVHIIQKKKKKKNTFSQTIAINFEDTEHLTAALWGKIATDK